MHFKFLMPMFALSVCLLMDGKTLVAALVAAYALSMDLIATAIERRK